MKTRRLIVAAVAVVPYVGLVMLALDQGLRSLDFFAGALTMLLFISWSFIVHAFDRALEIYHAKRGKMG